MEWIEGQSIRERLKDRPLKLDEALDIVIQAARDSKAKASALKRRTHPALWVAGRRGCQRIRLC